MLPIIHKILKFNLLFVIEMPPKLWYNYKCSKEKKTRESKRYLWIILKCMKQV